MTTPIRVVDHTGQLIQGDGTATTASLTAQNTFSTPKEIRGWFNFSLSGTWVAEVWVQRTFDDGATWLDTNPNNNPFVSNTQRVGFEPEAGVFYRFGVKTGGYTSGTVVGRLSQ